MKKLIALTLVAALFVAFSVSIAKAAEPNAPKMEPNKFRGRLVVVKDASGAITSAKLENRRLGTLNIVLDAKGKELAEKMADKFVAITGKVETKDNEKWLTVESYIEMKRPMGPRGPHDPNRPMPRRPGGPGAPGEGGQK